MWVMLRGSLALLDMMSCWSNVKEIDSDRSRIVAQWYAAKAQ